MNPNTVLFSQNWEATATQAAAGYMHNYKLFTGKRIRLLHISLQHEGVAHVKLWVEQGYNYYNLVDDDFGANRDAVWNGSLILNNATSIGSLCYGVADGDFNWLRIIWEELE